MNPLKRVVFLVFTSALKTTLAAIELGAAVSRLVKPRRQYSDSRDDGKRR